MAATVAVHDAQGAVRVPTPKATATVSGGRYELTLFVSGASAFSGRAIADVRAYAEANLPPDYRLDVVDVHQFPERITGSDVRAVPSLHR